MNEGRQAGVPSMTGPAAYRIRVQGALDAAWSDRIEGMNITNTTPGDGAAQTTLVGWLRDQAALSGVLNTLYELHFPVLSVECLENTDEGEYRCGSTE